MTRKYEIRIAKLADIKKYYGRPTQNRIRALVAYDTDTEEIMGIGGIKWEMEFGCEKAGIFMDMKKDIDVPKITIWRYSREMLDRIASWGFPMIALADCHIYKNTAKYLEKLGFIEVGKDAEGGLLFEYEGVK